MRGHICEDFCFKNFHFINLYYKVFETPVGLYFMNFNTVGLCLTNLYTRFFYFYLDTFHWNREVYLELPEVLLSA